MGTIDVLGSFQDPLNLDQGASKLINVRVVPRAKEEGKPAKVRFLGAPGLTQVCKPTNAPCISICHAQGTIWSGHADGSIYQGVEFASPILAGRVAVNPTQPIIRFAEDRTALCIASNANALGGGRAGTGYTAVAGVGVVNAGFDVSINFDPTTVAELDNITIWSGASNFYANQDSKMYRSQQLQPTNVDPNFFATKEARADPVADLAISGRVLWPLGTRSLEQWYDAGSDADFPFTAFPNSVNSVGLGVRTSLAWVRDTLLFVATDRRVWLCSGQTGQAVSPPWVDLLLQQLNFGDLGKLTAYAYGQGGSDFYVLTFPGQWTLELAAATGAWSYRQTAGRADHAGRCATEHDGGITYVGLDTGEICALDITSPSEPAGTLSRTIITPWVGGAAGSLTAPATSGQETRQTYNALDITSSMGPTAGTFSLDWSDTTDNAEGPRTWLGLRQLAMPLPGVQRAIGRNFGTGRRRQFRLQYSGTKAPFSIDEMFLHVTPGS